MQVYHVYKNMVEQSRALSIYKEYLNHKLGLTLSTPGLVLSIILVLNKKWHKNIKHSNIHLLEYLLFGQ